jgi:solute carrier family 6 amino acid/orphan transporter-like 15/16/17/18/20
MLLLELTLGQKMQRGSVGSMRGITPRLAGVGWAASFSGFITCVVYNVLLGMCLVYLVQSGGDAQPWTEKNLERPLACQTAALMGTPSAEIYLFLNVTSLYGETSCSTFEEGDGGRFSTGLFIANLICWAAIFAGVVVGPKLIQGVALVSVPLRFIFLIILVIHYTGLNAEENGKGIGWYLGGTPFPLPPDGTYKNG